MDITIGVIIALIALLSPIFTTYLTNKHQLEIRKLEIDSDNKNNERKYKRDICKRYLEAVGIVSNHFTPSALKELSISHTLLSPYVPEDKRIQFDEYLNEFKFQEKNNDLPNNLDSLYKYEILPTVEKILKEPIE